MRVCNQKGQEHDHIDNMKRTAIVVIITVLTMIAEITYGLITGSMALLADGIHMGTHTFAMLITLLAYYISHKHRSNPNFPFSSGKVGILGGYTNSIVLGITAVFMVIESVERLLNPEEIMFGQALFVAVFGLIINIISAMLLSGDHHHGDHEHHHDHNLRAAYIHVITDALTSILAIVALVIGKFYSYTWPDALVAVLGAIVILKWAYGLLISSGKLLVDYVPVETHCKKIEEIIKKSGSEILDQHIWKCSERDIMAILSIKKSEEIDKQELFHRIKEECKLSHLTLSLD